MSYAIVGFSKIGHDLAKAFARNGIEVSVAATRDPASFASDAAAIGPEIIPKTLRSADLPRPGQARQMNTTSPPAGTRRTRSDRARSNPGEMEKFL